VNGAAYVVGSSVSLSVSGSSTANVSWRYNPVAQVVLSAPSAAMAGGGFAVTVVAQDAYGNRAIGYSGTVALTSSDPLFIGASHAFTAADGGSYTFQNVVLKTAGAQTITARDAANLAASASIAVAPAGAPPLPFPAPRAPAPGLPSRWAWNRRTPSAIAR